MVRVELMKLFAHPFFFVSLALLLGATALAAASIAGKDPTAWRGPHAVEIFAAGTKWGLRLAEYVLLVYGAMLFAGEFDRGTIKVLLTRPVTRTDVFAAKAITGVILAILLVAAILSVAWGLGCAWGELGPVWDGDHYVVFIGADVLQSHLERALGTAIPSVVAFVFVGLLLSNLMESSGYAVALALIAAVAINAATAMIASLAPCWAGFYPAYALETLQDYARGSATRWKPELHDQGLPLIVPLVTLALSSIGGFAVFRARNIIA